MQIKDVAGVAWGAAAMKFESVLGLYIFPISVSFMYHYASAES